MEDIRMGCIHVLKFDQSKTIYTHELEAVDKLRLQIKRPILSFLKRRQDKVFSYHPGITLQMVVDALLMNVIESYSVVFYQQNHLNKNSFDEAKAELLKMVPYLENHVRVFMEHTASHVCEDLQNVYHELSQVELNCKNKDD